MISTDKVLHVVPVLVNSPSPGRAASSSSSMFVSHSSVLVASLSIPKFKLLSFSSNDPPNLSSCDGLLKLQRYKFGKALMLQPIISVNRQEFCRKPYGVKDRENFRRSLSGVTAFSSATVSWLASSQVAYSATDIKIDPVYEEQVRSGDASATELFELGAVMLRRKFYPAATKYLLQAIEKWDGDDQDLAQVYNALGVCYILEGKLEKGISQFENAVKLQPGYVTAWNNLGDAYEKKKDLKSALKAFEEALLFDPNNKVARPRVDSLRDRVNMYKGVPVKSKER